MDHASGARAWVMGHDGDVLTVLIDREGHRTLSRKAVLGHGLLTRA